MSRVRSQAERLLDEATQVLEEADARLEPIRGPTGFDHLPVRGALAILLDRLLA